MSEARAAQPRPSDEPRKEDPSPAASARFRIKIDPLGRIIPEVVPVEEDATEERDAS